MLTETTTSEMPEAARRAVIDDYRVEADAISGRLNGMAALAAKLCDAPCGLVILVEDESPRIVGRSGTGFRDGTTLRSLCAASTGEADGLVILDASADPRFAPLAGFCVSHPLTSPDGIPIGCICVLDPSPREAFPADRVEALKNLAEAVMAILERSLLERSSSQYQARSRTEIADLEQRFQVLADAMPQLVWSTGADGMVDYLNQGWCDFTGRPAEESKGDRWTRFLHDDDKAIASLNWAQAVATGQNYEAEYRLLHRDGSYRWMLARGVPMVGDGGTITRWIGTCTDIHEQKADAERLEILSRELNHRIKNIFAVIGGLIAMTSRSTPGFRDAAIELRDRVLALGRAHDFVRSRGGQPALNPHGRLVGLLHTLLAPYQDETNERIVLDGDDIAIDDRSATPLALFFHELATNAAKYGALSVGEGKVRINVRNLEDGQIELDWSEDGGPPVLAAGKPGFGSSLVEMSIVRQLGGTLDYDWCKQGLRVVACIPVDVFAR